MHPGNLPGCGLPGDPLWPLVFWARGLPELRRAPTVAVQNASFSPFPAPSPAFLGAVSLVLVHSVDGRSSGICLVCELLTHVTLCNSFM